MSKPINLDQWKPKKHPLKDEIKKHGVSITIIANYLGLHYSYTSSMLNGIYPLPKKHEVRIKGLLDSIAKGGL